MFNKVIESIWKSIDTKEKNYEEINKTYYAKDEVYSVTFNNTETDTTGSLVIIIDMDLISALGGRVPRGER
ncbi:MULTISPECIES: hypothetical protein [unclassified Psychrobacillus]|uniref:hypothetical protein n=1 Tax=unclassified Psychrobacillus TaxID=2636677 RepID=UPI0030F80655